MASIFICIFNLTEKLKFYQTLNDQNKKQRRSLRTKKNKKIKLKIILYYITL